MSLKIESKNGIVTVSLNRPEVRNAFDAAMIRQLTEQFLSFHGAGTDLRAVVLKGEGKTFCGGADLASMKAMVDLSYAENVQDAERLYELFKAIEDCPLPVIGVVHGAAFGGALGLLSVCDFVLAEKTTQFCFSEVRLGISPAVISAFILKRIAKAQVAPYMNLGISFDATSALRMGLIHQEAEEASLSVQLDLILEQVRKNGPLAMRATKTLLKEVPSLASESAKSWGTGLIAALRVSPEGQEGLRSFLEKRTPNWIQKGSPQ